MNGLLWAVVGLAWTGAQLGCANAASSEQDSFSAQTTPTKNPPQSPSRSPSGSPSGSPSRSPSGPSAPPELWEPGDEVVPPKPLPPGKGPGGTTGANDGRGRPAGEPAADDGGPTWSVLVGTFTGDDHAAAAAAARDRLAAKIPQAKECFVRRVAKGSVLLIGRFTGPNDPAAQAKLKELKALVVDGQRPFAGALLTRTSTDAAPPGPYDLRVLRAQFPSVKPLYTLQVAVWSTFGDKSVRPADMRAAAEKYCKELRAKRVEAWVHHDDDTGTSSVTVGHFDHTAYDAKSTLFSAEVERYMKQFPRHLVNGEEVLVPVDPRKPEGAKRPQGCKLVEVPLN